MSDQQYENTIASLDDRIEELEEHNQNAQSMNGLLELRVEVLEAEVKLQSDSADHWEEEAMMWMRRCGEQTAEKAALVEAAKAVVEKRTKTGIRTANLCTVVDALANLLEVENE